METNILKFTVENTSTILSLADKPVFVVYYTDYCIFCRIFLIYLIKIAPKHPEVYFGILNVTEEAQFRLDEGLLDVPALRLYKNGECVREEKGITTEEKLMSFAEEILNG